MRDILISDLYRDVLGPRNGPYETVDGDPINEYITGVLAPRRYEAERDPDSEAEIPSQAPEGVEPLPEDDITDDVPLFLSQKTFLDPASRPRSMGVSFCVSGNGSQPVVRICATWARYFPENGMWKRAPRAFVTDPIKIGRENRITLYADGNGRMCSRDAAEIGIYVISRELSSGVFHVSVFLVNEIEPAGDIPRTSLHIFQPQIRIRCVRGSLRPVRMFSTTDPEERELELIYRRRAILARGHMCSAVWREIDPENIPPRLNSPGTPPFHWVDGDILDENIRREFTSPDVRSEFVPVVSVEAPVYDWNTKWGAEPELRAGVLAELWDPEKLKASLLPLVEGYGKWIEKLERDSRNLSGEGRTVAERIIERCRMVLERMKKSIQLLARDSDVRLAFCFANKAMDLQYGWRHGPEDGLRWRPFQLAFMLLVLESLVNDDSPSRNVCDILFVPTGAGKTEAYLGVAAFALALRRRMSLTGRRKNTAGNGTGVIMRYTLRLLTIQQFRRALRMITACEYLRVFGLGRGMPVGWRPKECDIQDDFIWGTARFSIGLWVGGGVTPNRLQRVFAGGRRINGTLEILRGEQGEGEPAQVLECPVCRSVLSIPEKGLPAGKSCVIHLLVRTSGIPSRRRFERALNGVINGLSAERKETLSPQLLGITEHGNGFLTISLELRPSQETGSGAVDSLWDEIERGLSRHGVRTLLCSARASRPGYFILRARTGRGTERPYNFAIYCPNPGCELNSGKNLWTEGRPAGLQDEIPNGDRIVHSPDGMEFAEVPEFARAGNSRVLAFRIPVPALTVDEQVYTDPPAFLIGTVDKVARLSFESRYGSLFGNVNRYSPVAGYYREGVPPPSFKGLIGRSARDVEPLDSPELVIQDELHLIEGPLGSMVGIYETVLDFLSIRNGRKLKYIASSATVREAPAQVMAVFVREVLQFPPPGIDADDRFFMRYRHSHPLDESRPGRVYMGICSPGMGSLTPVVRIWARLLQTSLELAERHGREADPFWTIVGYFNAIRELAGTLSLYRQDIPERIRNIAGSSPRELTEERILELSSRVKSTELPALLEKVETSFSGNTENPRAADALFTTSMFGTGVDVPRLSLMVVHGQPKTTSSYIQSTGRAGRRRAGLVVTFYRATRPRDMSHYEMFCGYHLNLERFVEPVTAAPFSPGTLQRCAGPVAVAILRNMLYTAVGWHRDNSAHLMAGNRQSREVTVIPYIFEERGQLQPGFRKPDPGKIRYDVEAALDDWRRIAQQVGNRLRYVEYVAAMNPVVLGDPQHQHGGLPVVYENTPQSLRDIEETTGFET